MAIDVNWITGVISIPRVDMTLIQASPEVRELDAEQFHLDLRTIHADTQGTPYSRTHNHTPESVLSGITYGRVVEILNPYTLELEDGTYGVTVVGANTNFLDVKVANQVSLLGNNSAGLVNLNNILATLNYQGSVWVSASGASGTIKGVNGIPSNPVDNMADAVTLLGVLGLRSVRILDGSFTLTAAFDGGEIILGNGATLDFGGFSIDGTLVRGGMVTGIQGGTGEAGFVNLLLDGVTGFRGNASGCGLKGVIGIAGTSNEMFACHSHIVGAGAPTIDFVGPGRTLVCRQYSGGIAMRNIADPTNEFSLDMVSGRVVLESSCSDGSVWIRGLIPSPEDSSTGTIVNTVGVLTPEVTHMGAIWIDTANGTPGTAPGVNGTPGLPVTTLADALTLATATGFRSIVLVSGNLTLTSALTEFLVEMRNESEINLGGQNVNGTEFRGGIIKGAMTGVITCSSMHIEDVDGFRGDAQLCGLQGTITCGAGTSHLDLCHSDVPGLSTPTIVFGDATTKVNLRAYSGGIQIEGMTLPAHEMSAEFIRGQIIIDSSCTGGTLVVRGEIPKIDNSAGTIVNIDGYIEPTLGMMAFYEGAVWFDSVAGSPGSVLGVNGTQDNPSNNETDTLALAAVLGVKHIRVDNGTLLATGPYDSWDIEVTTGGVFNFGSQIISECRFFGGGAATGITAAGSGNNIFAEIDCIQNTMHLLEMRDCRLGGTMVFIGTAVLISRCKGLLDSLADLVFDLSNGIADLTIADAPQSLRITNMAVGTNVWLASSGGTRVVLDATCTGGTIITSGVGEVVDESGGAVAIEDRFVAKTIWSATQTNNTDVDTMGELLDDAAAKAALAAALAASG